MKQLFAISACLLLLFVGIALYQESPKAADRETVIVLSDTGITVNGGDETASVFTSHDIIYYEDKDFHDGGHIYGEGLPADHHSAEEAAAHTVVNITTPGTYRVTGKLSAGQIRIDLGKEARYDPDAVVNLILSDTDITCTVAPAILFLNVYECDGTWSLRHTDIEVDTTGAGANLILEGTNTVRGSYVAKIYKDNGKQKKLWKQDGAIHSYMSLNIDGPGSLDLTAEKEGISSELHMTMWNGDVRIHAMDDGINASEDNVSVVAIRGGNLRILSGLGEVEGDGIDSNGYLEFYGGTTVVWSTPLDACLDGDYGNMMHGGTVIALGSSEELAHRNSGISAINLVGCFLPETDSSIAVIDETGKAVLAYDPSKDDVLGTHTRPYAAVILSSSDLSEGQTYSVQLGAALTGAHTNGVYRNAVVSQPGIPMQLGSASKEDGIMVFQPEDGQTALYMKDRVCKFEVAPIDVK